MVISTNAMRRNLSKGDYSALAGLNQFMLNQDPGDILHSYATIDLIKKYLNFRPKVNFIEGLASTLNHRSG